MGGTRREECTEIQNSMALGVEKCSGNHSKAKHHQKHLLSKASFKDKHFVIHRSFLLNVAD